MYVPALLERDKLTSNLGLLYSQRLRSSFKAVLRFKDILLCPSTSQSGISAPTVHPVSSRSASISSLRSHAPPHNHISSSYFCHVDGLQCGKGTSPSIASLSASHPPRDSTALLVYQSTDQLILALFSNEAGQTSHGIHGMTISRDGECYAIIMGRYSGMSELDSRGYIPIRRKGAGWHRVEVGDMNMRELIPLQECCCMDNILRRII